MSRIVLLDAGPLGLVTGPRSSQTMIAAQMWLEGLLDAGGQVRVADIADYEVRRELLRARKTRGVQRLDALRVRIGHLPVTTETLLLAAEFWARLRQQGQPMAGPTELDGDVILAAQAALLIGAANTVVVATTNVGHLSRLVPAELWQNITS
jgi:predicted nucleic acid-binding protein